MEPSERQLQSLFIEVNQKWFEGNLPTCRLSWNSRLRVAAGRFVPVRRKDPPESALIEVALYLLEETEREKWVIDTLSHEMIHYWLWFRRRPHGHTKEFYEKMIEMGVSRYNVIPRRRSHKYIYLCPVCTKRFLARKRLGKMACADCCKRFNRGKFDRRFELVLYKNIDE